MSGSGYPAGSPRALLSENPSHQKTEKSSSSLQNPSATSRRERASAGKMTPELLRFVQFGLGASPVYFVGMRAGLHTLRGSGLSRVLQPRSRPAGNRGLYSRQSSLREAWRHGEGESKGPDAVSLAMLTQGILAKTLSLAFFAPGGAPGARNPISRESIGRIP